jgi:hypothetical protein
LATRCAIDHRARSAAIDAADRYRRVEREPIRERTGDGRKRKLRDYRRTEAIERCDAGETLANITKSYGAAISMISRLRIGRNWSTAKAHQYIRGRLCSC